MLFSVNSINDVFFHRCRLMYGVLGESGIVDVPGVDQNGTLGSPVDEREPAT